MPEPVFHIIPEDPQVQHIPPDMDPPGMHKHRGEDGEEIPARICEEAGGNKRPHLNKCIASGEFYKKKEHIERNQGIRNVRDKPSSAVVIPDRKHKVPRILLVAVVYLYTFVSGEEWNHPWIPFRPWSGPVRTSGGAVTTFHSAAFNEERKGRRGSSVRGNLYDDPSRE